MTYEKFIMTLEDLLNRKDLQLVMKKYPHSCETLFSFIDNQTQNQSLSFAWSPNRETSTQMFQRLEELADDFKQRQLIKQQPIYARWNQRDTRSDTSRCYCTNCKAEVDAIKSLYYKFCPECGAVMLGSTITDRLSKRGKNE